MNNEGGKPMMTLDESNWPILILASAGRTTLEDTQLYSSTLDRALARQQPFAIIAIAQRDEVEGDQEAANHFMKWLKTNKPLMTQYCRGMATVVESEEYLAKHGQVLMQQGQQIYGCPVTVVRTRPEADKWV